MRKRQTRQQLLEEFNKLDFTSDFIFSHLMKDETLCKRLIELLLKIKIEKIVYHDTQKIVRISPASRGVRFDAYLEDQDKIIDIEMQCSNYSNLPKRARYYQSIIDVQNLKNRQDFNMLKESYVIFICTKDPLNYGLPVYTIMQTVKESSEIKYDDFSRKVFYNASAWESCQDKEVAAFLKFLSTREPTSEFTSDLKSLIKRTKANMSLKEKFLSIRQHKIEREIDEMEMREEAIEQGLKQGLEQGMELGLEQGLEQGRNEGMELGQKKAKIEIAKTLLFNNINTDIISKSTGLSVEEINALR